MKKILIVAASAGVAAFMALTYMQRSADEAQKTLRLYVWTDYIDKEIIKEFETKYSVKVLEENFPSNEVMISKLKAGGGGYDIIVPSDYMITTMRQDNLLMKLPKDKIPNLSHLAEQFRSVSYDEQIEYTVPYMWGTTGIAYNSQKVANPPKTWKEFFDPEFAKSATKRLSLLDDPREVLGAALKSNGHSLNSTANEELTLAKQKIIALKPLISRFDTMSYKDLLASGDLWMAQAYSGDIVKMQKTNPELRYVIPEDGATLWVDNLAIPAGAPNPALAAEFINFVMTPEINQRIALSIHYATTNQSARDLLPASELGNASIYPPTEVESRLELLRDLGPQSEQIDTVWAEVRSETETIRAESPTALKE